MAQIVWTKSARQEVKNIFEYWNKRNQSTSYTKKLKRVIQDQLVVIASYPKIGRSTNLSGITAKVILSHFILIYRIEEGDQILILAFWDTRQDPDLNQYL